MKLISLNNKPCIARSTLIDLNPDELHCYSFMVDSERGKGSSNDLVVCRSFLKDLSKIISTLAQFTTVNIRKLKIS